MLRRINGFQQGLVWTEPPYIWTVLCCVGDFQVLLATEPANTDEWLALWVGSLNAVFHRLSPYLATFPHGKPRVAFRIVVSHLRQSAPK